MIKRRKSDDFFFRLLEYEFLIDFRGGEDEKKISLKRAKKCSMDNFFIKAAVVTYRANVLFIYYYLLDWYLLGL